MTVHPARSWAVFLLAGAMAAGAAAQAMRDNERDPPPPVPGLVLSDAEPLPAEDRESAGAVVLDQRNGPEALEHLERYLQLRPDAPDAKDVRKTITEVRGLVQG